MIINEKIKNGLDWLQTIVNTFDDIEITFRNEDKGFYVSWKTISAEVNTIEELAEVLSAFRVLENAGAKDD